MKIFSPFLFQGDGISNIRMSGFKCWTEYSTKITTKHAAVTPDTFENLKHEEQPIF
jgi:hypothetical protein